MISNLDFFIFTILRTNSSIRQVGDTVLAEIPVDHLDDLGVDMGGFPKV